MPELQCRVSPEHRPGPEPDCVHGEKAGPESDSPALAETRMGLWLAMGSSLSSVGGRRKQKSALSRSGKSAGAGHWAGGGTRRVHEEPARVLERARCPCLGPVPLSRLPDESGVLVRLIDCSGAGLQMRPARLCTSGYRCHGLIHHRRSRQAARPTGRSQPARPTLPTP
jgi:hypothetical protein